MTLAADFPTYQLDAGRDVFRIHRQSPWWFSADGGGRFDPVGTTVGACYLAEDPLGAWIEVFRKPMLLPEAEVKARQLLTVAFSDPIVLADLTSRDALKYGVTASLGADVDLEPSQSFAADAVDSGFAGVRYFARHDPAQQLASIALFHERGEHPDWTSFSREESVPVPHDLIDEACDTFGYRVLPTP